MKLITPSSLRATPLDRNPLTILRVFEGQAVAPHALVVRATYTVPANRRFYLGYAVLFVRRRTAGTPVGNYQMVCNFATGSGPKVLSTKNAVDDIMQQAVSGGMVFTAGQVLTVETSDASTGGTVDYYGGFMGTEVDA